MYEIQFTTKMKRDVKRMKKRGKDNDMLILTATGTGSHSDLFGE